MSNEKNIDASTHCHDCVFADIYKVEGIVEPQFAQQKCRLDRLDKFPDKELVEIDGTTAYKINRVCMACRDDKWAEGKHDIVKDVYKEMEITIDFVLVLDTFSVTSLHITLDSILNQVVMPRSIILVVDPEKYPNISDYFSVLSTKLEDTDIKYQLIKCFEKDVVYERLVDVGVGKCRSVYYTHYRTGEKVPTNFTAAINHYYVKKVKRFILIEAFKNHHEVMFTSYHKLIGGNDGGYILDKVNYRAKQQEKFEFVQQSL